MTGATSDTCSRVAKRRACHVVCKVVSMLAFASVFNLLYFLPEAPSTILSKQGPITCCGVSTIAADEAHFCK